MRLRLRTLRIGAAEFKWTAELCPPRCVRVRVWGGGKNGRRLVVDLAASGDPGSWGDDPDAAYPTPRVVRALIEHALDHGWNPADTGGGLEIWDVGDLEVPGFCVTDILEGYQHLRG